MSCSDEWSHVAKHSDRQCDVAFSVTVRDIRQLEEERSLEGLFFSLLLKGFNSKDSFHEISISQCSFCDLSVYQIFVPEVVN